MPPQIDNTSPPSHAEVASLVGDVDDSVIAAIVGTGATYLEIEEAVKWATGEAEELGKSGHVLSPAAAAVYDILMADPSYEPEAER